MTYAWEARKPLRPDPYLDWELVNAPPVNGGVLPERWCSVVLQVLPGPAGNMTLNLERLRDLISNQSANDPPTIKVHSEEADQLDERILELQASTAPALATDDVRLQFFVYMPEALAYENGDYAHSQHYRIRLVGPPIQGLDFSPRTLREPSPRRRAMKTESNSPTVAIGVIDDGLAFAHERFRTLLTADRTVEATRVEHIWLQDLERAGALPDDGVAFGRRIKAAEINASFRKSEARIGSIDDRAVYRDLGVLDFRQAGKKSIARRRSHGTHVLDLACGFPRDDSAALDRPIYLVQLPDAATEDSSGVTMRSYVLQGIRQLMLWADRASAGPLPLVINFSYGFYAGPKDGSHVLEREIDRLVSHRNRTTPTAVVLPAGNSYRNRISAQFILDPNRPEQIDWFIQPDGASESYLEIWYDLATGGMQDPLKVSIAPPDSAIATTIMPAAGSATVLTDRGKPIAAVYAHVVDTASGKRGRVVLAVNPTVVRDSGKARARSGPWKLALTNVGAGALGVDVTIQRNDTPAGFRIKGRQSFFDHANAYERDAVTGNYDALGAKCSPCPITHANTLSAIGNGQSTVLVGAALAGAHSRPAEYASSGPTKARRGPDFSAIADEGAAYAGVLAAGTLSGTTALMRGSSVAAPQIARRLADAAVDRQALKQQCGTSAAIDPQLGSCELSATRPDIPARKRREV